MEYFFLICDIVRRNQYRQHRRYRIVSNRLKKKLENNVENIFNLTKNICGNIGLSIIKFKNELSDFSDWSFLLNDIVPKNNFCNGKYLDCKQDEISLNDLNIFASYIQNINKSNSPIRPPIIECIANTVCYKENNLIGKIYDPNEERKMNDPSETRKTEGNEHFFKTAHEELIVQKQQTVPANRARCGTTKRSVSSKYKKPELLTNKKDDVEINNDITNLQHDRLRNIDENMIKLICNEIMHKFKPISWEDIAGLEYAKATIQEAVVWPILRPDIFTGLRRPPRGILLFGPPGTGKTLIGKCIASQSKSTFFSISASSLTSKWIGEGEKMVRALFAVASVKQPSVIFIDEIDSLLCQRTETEHESSRRIKTEFLVQLDGAGTRDSERLLIVGATNRPQELDEAARRRFVRRLYIPLPEFQARIQIIKNLLSTERNDLTESEFILIGEMSDGYSAADMESLCREASMEPIRSIPATDIPFFNEKQVRSVNYKDFLTAFKRVRTSVSPNELLQYEKWNNIFGANNSK